MEEDLDGLLELLDEWELSGTTRIYYKYPTNYPKSEIERDLRMAKVFKFPHPKWPRIIEIHGDSDIDYDAINFRLDNNCTLEWIAEKSRSQRTNNLGLSLILDNPKTGERIQLLNEEMVDISHQSYKYMMIETYGSMHYIGPVMRSLVLMGTIIATYIEEILNKQGYTAKCQTKATT